MLLVYIEHITPRHRFIFNFLLKEILCIHYELTDDQDVFRDYIGPRFSYGMKRIIDPGLHLGAHRILSEKGIRLQEINMASWNGLPVFFSPEGPSELPFDPFAMAFYLVTRYEEYLPFEPDVHGRFPAEASLGFREGFLGIPLADIIAGHLKDMLMEHFPQLEMAEKTYRFIPTFDIDIAFAHLGKGFSRATAAWAKLMLTFNFREMRERLLVLAGRMDDPYNNFDFQQYLTTQYGYDSIYFALMGDFSRFDRNTSYRNRRFRELLGRISRTSEVGLHPSYKSHLDPEFLQSEKARLEEILDITVTRSRFHFLRFKFPESFRILIRAGFTDDYSLGYSTLNSFRAGTCTPFIFYDLENEEETGLKMHPFCLMDSAMIDHMALDPEQAAEHIDRFLEPVRICGGEAIGIWHNYALSEKHQYRGWKRLLEAVLSEYNNQSL